MWEKLQIYKTPISDYEHEGFILEYNRHRISNLVNNYFIQLPFKLFPIINLYSYELVFTNNYLVLNMMINIDALVNKLDNYSKIPRKNDLFDMLKYIDSKKLPKLIPPFRRLKSPIKLIEKYEIIPYHLANVIEISNLLFDLTAETITKADNSVNIFCLDIFFIFCYTLDLHKYENICIIDDSTKFNNNFNIINKNNYKNITKSFFNQGNIIIDRNFFISKIYTNSYKEFHTNVNSIYAYNSYKSYIDHGGSSINMFNIELLNNFTIILNDVTLDKIYNHPIKYTTQKKIFIYSGISSDIIEQSSIYINDYYQSKFNYTINTDTFLNRLYFLPDNLYNYKRNITELKVDLYCPNNIDTEYRLGSCIEESVCPINGYSILNSSHCKFQCNHKFIIDNLSYFTNSYHNCPVCMKTINTITSIVNPSNIIVDLIGEDFFKIYDIHNNYYIIGISNSKLTRFISSNINNIYFIDTACLNIVRPAVLCFLDSYNYLDILHFIKDIDTNLINSIFKISQSI